MDVRLHEITADTGYIIYCIASYILPILYMSKKVLMSSMYSWMAYRHARTRLKFADFHKHCNYDGWSNLGFTDEARFSSYGHLDVNREQVEWHVPCNIVELLQCEVVFPLMEKLTFRRNFV